MLSELVQVTLVPALTVMLTGENAKPLMVMAWAEMTGVGGVVLLVIGTAVTGVVVVVVGELSSLVGPAELAVGFAVEAELPLDSLVAAGVVVVEVVVEEQPAPSTRVLAQTKAKRDFFIWFDYIIEYKRAPLRSSHVYLLDNYLVAADDANQHDDDGDDEQDVNEAAKDVGGHETK